MTDAPFNEQQHELEHGVRWVGEIDGRRGMLAGGSVSVNAIMRTLIEALGVPNSQPKPVKPEIRSGLNLGDVDWDEAMTLVGYELAMDFWAYKDDIYTRPAAYRAAEQLVVKEDIDSFVDDFDDRIAGHTLMTFGANGNSRPAFGAIVICLFEFGGGFSFVGYQSHEDMYWDSHWMYESVDATNELAVRKAAMKTLSYFAEYWERDLYEQTQLFSPLTSEDLVNTYEEAFDHGLGDLVERMPQTRHEWKTLTNSRWFAFADWMEEQFAGTTWPIDSPEQRRTLIEAYVEAVLDDRFGWG